LIAFIHTTTVSLSQQGRQCAREVDAYLSSLDGGAAAASSRLPGPGGVLIPTPLATSVVAV